MESLGGRFDYVYQDAQNGCGYSNEVPRLAVAPCKSQKWELGV